MKEIEIITKDRITCHPPDSKVIPATAMIHVDDRYIGQIFYNIGGLGPVREECPWGYLTCTVSPSKEIWEGHTGAWDALLALLDATGYELELKPPWEK